MTSPFEFFAAIASARLSRVSASRSMEMLRPVGRGAADQGDVQRDGLVEDPFLAVDLHQAHEVVGCAGALAAVVGWVDERSKAYVRQSPGPSPGDVSEEQR